MNYYTKDRFDIRYEANICINCCELYNSLLESLNCECICENYYNDNDYESKFLDKNGYKYCEKKNKVIKK
jgi:hypothetical protein